MQWKNPQKKKKKKKKKILCSCFFGPPASQFNDRFQMIFGYCKFFIDTWMKQSTQRGKETKKSLFLIIILLISIFSNVKGPIS